MPPICMITIIDYKAGNLTSVQLAFEHLGKRVHITDKPKEVLEAKQIVFPGVGAAGAAMTNLRSLNLIEPIKKVIADGVPFLGICIGIQLLLDFSEEDGGTQCLGILPGKVKKFQSDDPTCKIPQMGWNAVKTQKHPIFEGIEDQSEFYFVHSYYTDCKRHEMVIGKTDYAGVTFASAVAYKNLAAVQFHAERSGRLGLRLLENFCKWGGKC